MQIPSSRQSRHSFHKNSMWKACLLPSQNRTCSFPAYGSLNQHRFPVPHIGCQMWFFQTFFVNTVDKRCQFCIFLWLIPYPLQFMFHVLSSLLCSACFASGDCWFANPFAPSAFTDFITTMGQSDFCTPLDLTPFARFRLALLLLQRCTDLPGTLELPCILATPLDPGGTLTFLL